jgi:cytochrome c oxidase subunit II
MQSMLTAAGSDAARIALLWWVFLAICSVIFVLVLGFTVYGLVVRREVTDDGERTKIRVITGSVVISVVILTGILFASVATGRATTTGPEDALTIEVIGHQWWWEVRYIGSSPHLSVTSANELHLPVGERVRLVLRSRDVIHSFWIPALGGKIDMFPDRHNTLWLQPTRTGVFRGQCAEFCGMQHGKMALVAVVHERDQFEEWLARERTPAPEPPDELAVRGREAFLGGTCATCHRIRGTDAHATLGPDLTRIGARRTLAAGTMPNTRARLTAWLVDPQQFKPGSLMPPTNLDAETLHAIVHYLEGLR